VRTPKLPDREIRALPETLSELPRPASPAPGLTAPASLLSVAWWPFGIVLRSIEVVADRGTADFFRARDNQRGQLTWVSARNSR
jgi:hypothetical protein